MLRSFVAAAVALALLLLPVAPAAASDNDIHGYVTDLRTGIAISDVCITLGPPISCATYTDSAGFYRIDLSAAPGGIGWDLNLLKRSAGYQDFYTGIFVVNGPTQKDVAMLPVGYPAPVPCIAPMGGTPTTTNYLPNITKFFGGLTGFQTPFIVQNTGTASTTLEVTFYRFSDGSCVTRRPVAALGPGRSFADVPNNDTDLPGNTQFSVVVRSFGSSIVSVVNEHQGVAARAEALSYDGFSAGAVSVSLPNIVRRFFGYHTPFIMQNLGGATTTVTARFVSFDGTVPVTFASRTIAPGQSKFVEPNSNDDALGAPGLADGKQYAVTLSSDQPIA
ncbi:MAG: hypothetical protein M3O91_01120, partial [Chloroflexota bacterium]|nr:hypothetical protein [Chloroflexota bacterium]